VNRALLFCSLAALGAATARAQAEQPQPSGTPAAPGGQRTSSLRQSPAPYVEKERPPQRRRLLVGPHAGIVHRTTSGDAAVVYATSFAFGAHARLELLDWFGVDPQALDWLDVRAWVTQAQHNVETPVGSFGLAGETWHLPDLEVTQLGARIEPTWKIREGVRTWIGAGAAWERLVLAPHKSHGTATVFVPKRTGVAVEFNAAVGSTLDLVRHWLALELSLSAAVVGEQTGSLFDNVQGYDAAGQARTVGGLPHFSSSYTGLVGLNLIL
jgi:hypothetical protein